MTRRRVASYGYKRPIANIRQTDSGAEKYDPGVREFCSGEMFSGQWGEPLHL